jgi:hypothetical protein
VSQVRLPWAPGGSGISISRKTDEFVTGIAKHRFHLRVDACSETFDQRCSLCPQRHGRYWRRENPAAWVVRRRLWREGDIALYERSLTKDKPAHELELVVIRVAKEKLMPGGNLVAAHEVYPADSRWGHYGWSFPVAMKPFVLDLARHAAWNKANRAGFIREAVHENWKTTHPASLSSRGQS